MPIIKTAELAGQALDVAVALALGYTVSGTAEQYGYTQWRRPKDNAIMAYAFRPSKSPSDGLHLMDERRIATWGAEDGGWRAASPADVPSGYPGDCYIDLDSMDGHHGPTRLIAGMRALVFMELGDTVDIPQELLA